MKRVLWSSAPRTVGDIYGFKLSMPNHFRFVHRVDHIHLDCNQSINIEKMKLVLCILLSLVAVARPQHYGGLTDFQDGPVRQQLDEKKFGMPSKTFLCNPAFSNCGKKTSNNRVLWCSIRMKICHQNESFLSFSHRVGTWDGGREQERQLSYCNLTGHYSSLVLMLHRFLSDG